MSYQILYSDDVSDSRFGFNLFNICDPRFAEWRLRHYNENPEECNNAVLMAFFVHIMHSHLQQGSGHIGTGLRIVPIHEYKQSRSYSLWLARGRSLCTSICCVLRHKNWNRGTIGTVSFVFREIPVLPQRRKLTSGLSRAYYTMLEARRLLATRALQNVGAVRGYPLM